MRRISAFSRKVLFPVSRPISGFSARDSQAKRTKHIRSLRSSGVGTEDANQVRVFADFTISALWILFAMFGLFHLSELGFLSGGAEQASFFAARSEFVGLRGTRSGFLMAASGRDPSRAFDLTPTGAGNTISVETDENLQGRSSRVSIEYPNLLPFLKESVDPSGRPGSRCVGSGMLASRPRLCGFTKIPPRREE